MLRIAPIQNDLYALIWKDDVRGTGTIGEVLELYTKFSDGIRSQIHDVDEDDYDTSYNVESRWYGCPVCGKQALMHWFDFCPMCAAPLKWKSRNAEWAHTE
jgi:rubrerythrin